MVAPPFFEETRPYEFSQSPVTTPCHSSRFPSLPKHSFCHEVDARDFQSISYILYTYATYLPKVTLFTNIAKIKH